MKNKSFSICFSENPPQNMNVLWLKYKDNEYSLNIYDDGKWEPLCSQNTLQETLRMLRRLYRAGVVDVREEVELQLNEKLQNLILDIDHINYSALDKSLSELLDEFYQTTLNLHPVAFSGFYTDLSKRERVYEEGDIDPLSISEIYSIWTTKII